MMKNFVAMFKTLPFLCGLFSLLLLFGSSIHGQDTSVVYSPEERSGDTSHKVLTGGIVVGADTFPFTYLNPFFKEGELDPAEKARMAKLRYNVQKVYPYAVTAAYVVQKVDDELLKRHKKKDRNAYLKEMRKELKNQFKGELKNLTTTQGQILVKLINRETGRQAYDIIKELRGGLQARLSQTAAGLFHNNLKNQYDPLGADRDIEAIVQEIEARNYYQYRVKVLEQKAVLNKDTK